MRFISKNEEDEVSLSDIEAQAEKNFNKIKEQVLARKEVVQDRYETDKNFIKSNIESVYGEDQMEPQSKLGRINKNVKILKARQIEAKKRRKLRFETQLQHKILNLEKWNLIRYMRAQSLQEKQKEMNKQRLARDWCIRAKTYHMIVKIYNKWILMN